jgi:hypothetical protein
MTVQQSEAEILEMRDSSKTDEHTMVWTPLEWRNGKNREPTWATGYYSEADRTVYNTGGRVYVGYGPALGCETSLRCGFQILHHCCGCGRQLAIKKYQLCPDCAAAWIREQAEYDTPCEGDRNEQYAQLPGF